MKIVRSRTVQGRLTADKARTTPYPYLREITSQAPVTSYKPPSKKNKIKKGKKVGGLRHGGIGGGDLAEHDGSSTSATPGSFGQSCFPTVSNQEVQATFCKRCGSVQHDTSFCSRKIGGGLMGC